MAVDVLVANVWMAVLLFLASRAQAFDRWTGADTSAICKRQVGPYFGSDVELIRRTL